MDIKIRCPVCGQEAMSTFLVYNIPNFGEAVLTSISCQHCGYKSSDVILTEDSNPKRYVLVIDSPEKLDYRVIRSSHGNIKIPELGLEIKSTGFTDGYITNVEGVLLRIEDDLREKIRNKQNEKQIDELIERIRKLREGKTKFTLSLV